MRKLLLTLALLLAAQTAFAQSSTYPTINCNNCGGGAGGPSSVVITSGNVGGFVTSITVSPTVQATSYAGSNAAPVVIGGLLLFDGAARAANGSGLVQSTRVTFASGSAPSLDVVLFNANPTASTVTDHANLAVVAADLGKVFAVLHVNDCTPLGAASPSVCQAGQQAVPFVLPAGQAIYAAVVARSSVTLGSTTDMGVTLGVLPN